MKKTSIIAIGVGLYLSSCVSSVSNKESRQQVNSALKAKELIEETCKAQGFDNINQFQTYEVIGNDHWKGLLGKIGKMWPQTNSDLNLKYIIGTFDGRVEYLNGKKEGDIAGLQSWKYYEKPKNEDLKFLKTDRKIEFGITALQYFFELPNRLKNAPILRYGGEKEFKGQKYDLVLATWAKVKRHKKNDQYMLWINKETKLVDYCEFTVHDAYLPGGSKFPASIEFADYRDVNGVKIPFKSFIYFGSPKKKQSKYLHRLEVKSFKFDTFKPSEIRPDSSIKPVGDSK